MYLESKKKEECTGCEACSQICGKKAILMREDQEGFRYPEINEKLCIKCGRCTSVCPIYNMPIKNKEDKYVFGGYCIDEKTRFESTSGGAFSAIATSFCDEQSVIFGAEADGLCVRHVGITGTKELQRIRKSKYSQSAMGNTYQEAKEALKDGKKVLFSGTPCQIAGLKNYLGNINTEALLTVEVVCEGVPSPLYIRKLEKYFKTKHGINILNIDYRYTDRTFFRKDYKKGRWDFEVMKITTDGGKEIKKDRWINPFWSIWLNHLMSRPSCYVCPFAKIDRVADITLGDLWGVHKYCPDLYGYNGGASLVIGNSEKGKQAIKNAQHKMFGREVSFSEAIKYQGPIRKNIEKNPNREAFMQDLKSKMSIEKINKKWAKTPTIKLLWQKYIWGNRQKVFIYKMTKITKRDFRRKDKDVLR